MKGNILVVENDEHFIDLIKYNLDEEDNIDIIKEGKKVLERLRDKDYNIIILSGDISEMGELQMCKEIRKISTIPIIIVSEKDDDLSKVLAFEYGADDYLIKPFNILELKARARSIFKRIEYSSLETKRHILKIEDIKINTLKRKISVQDQEINLTGKEFDLFYILSTSPGKVFTREELLKTVWGYAYYGDLRTVDVHIRRIRSKIEKNLKDTKYIMTKWGVGYYFEHSS